VPNACLSVPKKEALSEFPFAGKSCEVVEIAEARRRKVSVAQAPNKTTKVAWTGPTPISEVLTYDLAGNITQIQRENGSYTVAYDAIDQLVSSTGVYSRSMQYDLVGNRIQDSVNGVGHFVSNFLTDNGTFRTYAPDSDGMGDLATQMQGSARKTYTYRADDRLVDFEDGTHIDNYFYDSLGRRIAKRISGAGSDFSQNYVYLGEEDRIILGKAGDGTITAYFDGQSIDAHLAEVSIGSAKGYVTDHLGSVLNSDAAGSSHSFGLFGESASVSESAGGASVHYGFAGRQLDGESSTYFNRARNYDPSTGTWSSQDLVGAEAGENYYRYVSNSPAVFVDPEGLAQTVNKDLGGGGINLGQAAAGTTGMETSGKALSKVGATAAAAAVVAEVVPPVVEFCTLNPGTCEKIARDTPRAVSGATKTGAVLKAGYDFLTAPITATTCPKIHCEGHDCE